jgi:hypothetical protein
MIENLRNIYTSIESNGRPLLIEAVGFYSYPTLLTRSNDHANRLLRNIPLSRNTNTKVSNNN